MKSIYERTGKSYTQQGDYLLPNLQLNERPEYNIGIWGTALSSALKDASQGHLLQYTDYLLMPYFFYKMEN